MPLSEETERSRRNDRLRELGYEVPPEKALNRQPVDFPILLSLEASVSATVLK
jgi:hypothetical protein